VIGLDFSEPSVSAARWVATQFAPEAELVLVHSVLVPQPPRFLRDRFPDPVTLIEPARSGAETRLRALATSLGAGRARFEVRVGRAEEALAHVASASGADMIVVGKCGERGFPWNALGGTAERVLRSAEVPVLVVSHPRNAKPRRILAAVDDSEATPPVLHWAGFLAKQWHAEVTALHVVSSAVMSHVLSMAAIGAPDTETTPEFVHDEFRSDTARWMKELVDDGVAPAHADSEVTFGEAGQEILAASARLGSDLVILGDRGTGAVARALMGSTLREVLRSAATPVLVVGRAPTEPAGGT
jgi:nucleotide-binding universal stress UspA family protein